MLISITKNLTDYEKSIFIYSAISFYFSEFVRVQEKYGALESELDNTKSELMKTRVEKDEYEAKYGKIQKRVSSYYSKINSLQEENDRKLEMAGDLAPVSNDSKKVMRETLKMWIKISWQKLKP